MGVSAALGLPVHPAQQLYFIAKKKRQFSGLGLQKQGRGHSLETVPSACLQKK